MKFGISGCFNITYVCHPECFPTLFASASQGYCQFICRFFTAFTSVMALMDQTLSTGLFAITSSIGAIIVHGLQTIKDSDYEYKGRMSELMKKKKQE